MLKHIKSLLVNKLYSGIIFYSLLLGFYFLALSPINEVNESFFPFNIQNFDKIVHFTVFSFLAFFLSVHKSEMKGIQVLLSLFLVGLSIELLQDAMPYNRTFDYNDLIANTLGSLMGYGVFHFLYNQKNQTILKRKLH